MAERSARFSIALWVAVVAVSAGLMGFSQTLAFSNDEGFHLLAAQLINAGKRPYLDFFYQHVPLYAYLNAGWFSAFGDSWRSAHALSTLLTSGAIMLVAGFVFGRVPERRWRLATAITAVLLVGLHHLVIESGTVGMPYGLCLFLTVAAFRLVLASVSRNRGWLPAIAGLCAGSAAASSLLTAPVAPILFVWLLWHSRTGDRLNFCAKFLLGVAIPLLPILWLAMQAPRAVMFDVVEYHLFYRRTSSVPWAVGIRSDLKALYNMWFDSAQLLILLLLATVGILFPTNPSGWGSRQRAEISLCGWLIGGMGALTASASPPIFSYPILLVPFLSILASIGIYAIGSRLWRLSRPAWPAILFVGLFAIGGLRLPYYHYYNPYWRPQWRGYEEIALMLNRVTPTDGHVWAFDAIYFAARRLPPPGLENYWLYKMHLPPSIATPVHIVSSALLDEWLAAGRFATVVIDANDPRVDVLGLSHLYARRKRFHMYDMFWGRTPVEN